MGRRFLDWLTGKPPYQVHIDCGHDGEYSARLLNKDGEVQLIAPINARFSNPISARNDMQERLKELGFHGGYDNAKFTVEEKPA